MTFSKFSTSLNKGMNQVLRQVDWRLITLLCVGVVAISFYLSWWFQDSRLHSIWLVLGFIFALAYLGFQVIGHWLLFFLAELRARRPKTSTTRFTVDVFVTACGEDHALVRRCLVAARAMRGDALVWLLDDGRDAALKQMAAELGIGYITRDDRKDAKAGNLNHALALTKGDILAIFDVDHAPLPAYLEETLYHFDDPTVGFVQTMLTFRDLDERWVEQAGAKSSFAFYNPISTGMDTLGCVTMMGSNSLIRREALQAIGNYQPGLAEDLATSFALHRGGWRSAYVAEPLAPGLAPPDLPAWFTQQFKWARGVFEVLVVAFPKVWKKLTWGDRLAYGVRMTMYWLGLVVFLHLVATLTVLMRDQAHATTAFAQYLLHLAPLAACNALIQGVALKKWLHPSLRAHNMWKAVVLVYSTWPIYTLAWCMAVLRIPLAFRPTPKTPTGALNPWWLAPQFAVTGLLIGASIHAAMQANDWARLMVAAFGFALAVPHILFFWLLPADVKATAQPSLTNTLAE